LRQIKNGSFASEERSFARPETSVVIDQILVVKRERRSGDVLKKIARSNTRQSGLAAIPAAVDF